MRMRRTRQIIFSRKLASYAPKIWNMASRCGEEGDRLLESQQSPIANPLPRAPRRDGNLDSRGGYDCELVDTPPDTLQTSCPVCLQILKEPCIVSCCGYKFCSECIKKVETAAEKAPCPLCQKPFTHIRERALERSLNDLDVFCTNKKEGCEWKGKLSKLEGHLNRKPTHDNQLRGCQFVEVECIQQCGLRFQRRHVTAHETEQCKKRPYSCDYCRDYDSTFEDVTENHWPRCKLRPIACPNECSVYMIEQQNLDQHLLECPLAEVDCPFSYAGCNVRLPRKDMPSHTQDGNVHVLLLALFSQKLVEENQRLHLRTLEIEDETKKALQEIVHTLEEKMAEENRLLQAELAEICSRAAEKDKEMMELTRRYDCTVQQLQGLTQDVATNKTNADQRFEEANRVDSKLSQVCLLCNHHIQHNEAQDKVEFRYVFEEADGSIHEYSFNKEIEIRGMYLPKNIYNFTLKEFKSFEHNNRMEFPPFYAYSRGYKMCLQIRPQVNESYWPTNAHTEISIQIMKGPFDAVLKWPFRGVVTVLLLNQLDGAHGHCKSIFSYDNDTPNNITGRPINSYGESYFSFNVPHKTLSYNKSLKTQYIKDDCLKLRIVVET